MAQEIQNSTIEQQLENQAEADEAETEDDSYYQQLQLYRRNPLNVNNATEGDLQPLRFLTDFQIQKFLQYRRLMGPLLSFYELQAIPGWDVETINRIRPFVMVGPAYTLFETMNTRFSKGEHSLLMRVSQTLQKSKGFLPKDTLPPAYPGSPQRLLLRYKYTYKNLLQFGMLGEKDPGEQFFKGAQSKGFDFYSFHLFVRNLGVIKQLAIGDFTLNLGQGLLTYQSLGFRKSVDVMNIKRQTEILRPYNSPGEVNSLRGAAITLGQGPWSFTAFATRQKVSANAEVDSVYNEDYVSSILNNGYHRTSSETADRRNITQSSVGGRLHYKKGMFMAGVNAIHFSLSKPLRKDSLPYNYFTFSGNKLTAFSGEMSYTWRNLHAFGELAANPGGGMAGIAGLMANLDPRVDFSLLYRNIARNYASLYASAFTESTTPVNEKGLFTGMAIKPNRYFRIDAYADIFSFPWVRYRVNRPSKGKEFLLQLSWRPNKQTEVYTRLRSENKAINLSNTNGPFYETENVARQNWRTQVQYRVSSAITLRARAELMWYDQGGKQEEQGFLLFTDFFYKPMSKPLVFNMRLQYFETDGYNSRIYAFENDVLYSFSIPVFYDKG
ncbi:MAG TPA: helix-hairpin-helix domain-containing protein, partial [Phnomibacter sp.]|nr:helix-hairpin-helix domain-containing protein [Phnomibacter sp.]